ncbi:MAG: sulfatase/phosphatase domain-containing protein, partial [Myxococcota bacterium]
NNLARVDARVGEILQRLEDDGLAERSVVIFTSDHGDGLPRAKRWPYDSGIHVPLIVRWPGVLPAGSVNPELVSGVDLAPTILSVAGIPVPDPMQGRIFMGPERQPEPRYVYAARDRIDEQADRVRALRDRRWKYIRNFHPERPYVLDMSFRDHMPMMREMRALAEAGELRGAAALWFRPQRDPEELYDTLEDPHEVRNLAHDPRHADRLAEMRDALDDWLLTSGDLGLVEESELARRFWPGGAQPSTPTPQLRVGERGRVTATSATPGASIEIRVASGPWRLYQQPVEAAPGTLVKARATRYGWATSELQELRVR